MKQGLRLFLTKPTIGSHISKTPSHMPAAADCKGNQTAHSSPTSLHTAWKTVGPRGTSVVLKPVQVMGIEQVRKWGVCMLNEFRQFMGLRKFKSFEEWCGVSDVAVRLSLPSSFLVSVHTSPDRLPGKC